MNENDNNPFVNERRNVKVRKFFDAVRPFALHEEEKALVRKNLNAFTLRYPIRNEMVHTRTYDRVPFMVRLTRMFPAFATAAVILLIGAGVSASAESTLPGDHLYTVKVAVNERVRGIFKSSLQEKTEWEIELAARRLDEAERLATKGVFTEALQTAFAERLDGYSASLLAHAAELNEKNDSLTALALTTQYEATLRAHQNVLRGFIGTAEAADPREEALKRLAEHVGARADDATAQQDVSYEQLLQGDAAIVAERVNEIRAVADRGIREAALAIENHRTIFGTEPSSVVVVNFEEAGAALERGTEAITRGDYPTAVLELKLTLRSAEAAKILVRLQDNFEVRDSLR